MPSRLVVPSLSTKVINVLNVFRAISILEGLSYLAILCVAFGALSRDYGFHIGMTHGVLFMLYIVVSLAVAHKQSWSLKIWLPVFLASIIPLAFVGVELYLKRPAASNEAIAEPT